MYGHQSNHFSAGSYDVIAAVPSDEGYMSFGSNAAPNEQRQFWGSSEKLSEEKRYGYLNEGK